MQLVQLHSIGITSTYVEKTGLKGFPTYTREDHLHIRGENVQLKKLLLCHIGSPPHTWRKLIAVSAVLLVERITSTYVEKTGTLVS